MSDPSHKTNYRNFKGLVLSGKGNLPKKVSYPSNAKTLIYKAMWSLRGTCTWSCGSIGSVLLRAVKKCLCLWKSLPHWQSMWSVNVTLLMFLCFKSPWLHIHPWSPQNPHRTPAGRTLGKNICSIFPRSYEGCERCDVGAIPWHHIQAVIPPSASWKLSLMYFN